LTDLTLSIVTRVLEDGERIDMAAAAVDRRRQSDS